MELLVAIAAAIIIYVLQQQIFKKNWSENLTAKIEFKQDYINVGDRAELYEVINNAKKLPLSVLHVKFSSSRDFIYDDLDNSAITDQYHRNDVFSIMGNQKITRRLNFTAVKRGFFVVDKVEIITRDFFMSHSYAKYLNNYSSIYVLPSKFHNLQVENIYNTLYGEITRRDSIFEDPYTFRGIREYTTRDSMKRINWKNTARAGNLMVNVYDRASEQKIKILLNLETNIMIKMDEIREFAISLASSIAEKFIMDKIPVAIASNGMDVVTGDMDCVEAGTSADHLIMIDKYLARIKENAGLQQFMDIIGREIRNPDNTVSYIIISSYYKDDLLQQLDYMVSQGINIYMLVPYYDIQKFTCNRAYAYGLEVKYNEA